MNRVRTIACAAAIPIAALAIAAPTAIAAASSAPGGLVTLTDDTGTITVDVPATWSDVRTFGYQADNGESYPAITASPDIEAYGNSFDVGGMTFVALPFEPDTEGAANRYRVSGCTSEESQPYYDPAFFGTHVTQTGCGGGTAEFHSIAAHPLDQAFIAVLNIQITGPEEYPILDEILATFNTTGSAGSADANAPAATTAPAATIAPAETPFGAFPGPGGEIPPDWTPLVDDTQTIELAVPPTWADVSTAPGESSGIPTIVASTNLELFSTGDFTVPGVSFAALPFDPDTESQAINDYAFQQCSDGGLQTYDDGVFVGHLHTYSACGGGSTTAYTIAAGAPDGSFTAFVEIRLLGEPDDAATLNGILLAFNGIAAETPTTGTAPASPGTQPPVSPDTQVPAAPDGQTPSGFTTVVDDSQTIQVAVPDGWAAVSTSPSPIGNPWIRATTDAAGFDTFAAPGVMYEAWTFEADTGTHTVLAAYAGSCTDGGVEGFDNGMLVGHVRTYTACGGTSATVYRIVANPQDSSFTAMVVIQLIGAPTDPTTLQTVIDSLGPGT